MTHHSPRETIIARCLEAGLDNPSQAHLLLEVVTEIEELRDLVTGLIAERDHPVTFDLYVCRAGGVLPRYAKQ